jgi:hypothetical protein
MSWGCEQSVFSLAEGLDNSSPLAQKSADGMSRFSRAKALQSCEANFREGGLRTTPGLGNVDVMRRAFVRLLGITPRRYRELAH